ncbi:MAG: prepilin-type N-terminal cleavage/methylation domain-containing protein [Bacteriovoracaceae bacterium]
MTINSKSNFLNNLKGHNGFSIIEILMALVLLVVIFTMIPFGNSETQRQKMEHTMAKFDRTIAFSTSESILRNTIVRIKIDPSQEPMEYSVEYGQGSNMVLPQTKDFTRLSLKEREQELEKSKKLDSQFSKTEEFLESNEAIPEGISVYALGTTYRNDLLIDGPFYIYFYPTGEKDNTILIMNSVEEMATLAISPFEEKTVDEYFPFSESDLANLDYALENKAKEVFEKWLKK